MRLPWSDSRFDWSRVGHALGLLVLLGVVGLFVASSVPQIVGADEAYVVRSDSMAPAIKSGAVVFVSDVPADEIQVGDVITFEAPAAGGSGKVTHRVVDIVESETGPEFRTQGDANDAPDDPLIGSGELIGKVSFHVPLIGYGISIAGTKVGLLAFVVLPAIVLVVLELWDITKTDESSGDQM